MQTCWVKTAKGQRKASTCTEPGGSLKETGGQGVFLKHFAGCHMEEPLISQAATKSGWELGASAGRTCPGEELRSHQLPGQETSWD